MSTEAQNSRPRILRAPIRIFISLLIVGILLKILHLQYADITMTVAYMGIAVLYVLRFMAKRPKLFLDFVKVVLVLSWSMHGLMVLNHLAQRQFAYWTLITSFLLWFYLEGFSRFRRYFGF